MLFSSAIFIVWFLPLFLLTYSLVPSSFKNGTALAGSLIFYMWGAPVFCAVLVASALCDYLLTNRFLTTGAHIWIKIGIALNLGCLFIFKYFNFFIENARLITEELGLQFPMIAEIALPLGISFFTFQKISYLIDVSRRDSEPAKNFGDYILFVSLFPQLIAGPIIRYKDLNKQIEDRSHQEIYSFKLAGIQRFVLGLTKKVLIADVLAILADSAFQADQIGMISAIIGLLAYTFQIYYDFSGYSDMAIGLGMMMGFRFPENFDWPYVARGFRAFWQKWHMTLSSWMKDYLYIPLGGSKGSKYLTIRNLVIVFVLSGLWHGAAWTFLIWGLWHGAFILLDRYTGIFRSLDRVTSALLTFSLVSLGWIWFRATSFSNAVDYFAAIVSFDLAHSIEVTSRQWFTLGIAIAFAFLPASSRTYVRHFHGENNQRMIAKTVIAMVLLFLSLGQMAISESQPFIYFRF